ncbi:mitochondrial carrier domain-containing protein [Jimgerdemannia flammicorona]|uniref:Mitochondrial carrier domain-containing protein n=1 Tax=Jimgerdemannia flammicorona TaxID=994334 RepID=A0A433QZD1_9FUNG|nr:mitochondrial carrier domain-containing protein [Jimgerdemannia flammicorona]
MSLETRPAIHAELPLLITANLMDAVEDHDYESLGSNSSMLANAIAGALAGIAEHSIMFPVDSIKVPNRRVLTRMQVLNLTRQARYTGIGNAFSRITTTEGARTLWRGVNSVVIGAGPAHALYFATYEHCKEAFGGNVATEGHHLLATGAAGACATIAADALMNPFDGAYRL